MSTFAFKFGTVADLMFGFVRARDISGRMVLRFKRAELLTSCRSKRIEFETGKMYFTFSSSIAHACTLFREVVIVSNPGVCTLD